MFVNRTSLLRGRCARRNDWSVLATEAKLEENGARKKKKTRGPSPSGSRRRVSWRTQSRTHAGGGVAMRDAIRPSSSRSAARRWTARWTSSRTSTSSPRPFEALAERRGSRAEGGGGGEEGWRGDEFRGGCRGRAARVHGGFLRAYESVRARVFAAVDDVIAAETHAREDDHDARDDDHDARDDTWHVFVTGHSLGGALATLFACELAESASGPGAPGTSRSRCTITGALAWATAHSATRTTHSFRTACASSTAGTSCRRFRRCSGTDTSTAACASRWAQRRRRDRALRPRGTDRYGETARTADRRERLGSGLRLRRRKHRAPRGEARGGREPGRGRGDGGGRGGGARPLVAGRAGGPFRGRVLRRAARGEEDATRDSRS